VSTPEKSGVAAFVEFAKRYNIPIIIEANRDFDALYANPGAIRIVEKLYG
jgi:hypothetical protein